MDVLTKLYTTADRKSIDVKSKRVTAWASRAIIDRSDELILGTAWMQKGSTENFEKHPVLLASHVYNDLSAILGKVETLHKSNEGLRFTARFASTPAAEEALAIINELELSATFSVGFQPRGFRDHTKDEVKAMGFDVSAVTSNRVRVYTDCELLEISMVSVPANPACTSLGKAFLDGRVKSVELKAALASWAHEIDAAEIDNAISRVAVSAVNKADLSAMVKAAVGEAKKDVVNEQLRKRFRESIMAEMRAERAAEAKRLRPRERVNMSDPASVERYVTEILESIDFDAMLREQTELAILKAKGRVR